MTPPPPPPPPRPSRATSSSATPPGATPPGATPPGASPSGASPSGGGSGGLPIAGLSPRVELALLVAVAAVEVATVPGLDPPRLTVCLAAVAVLPLGRRHPVPALLATLPAAALGLLLLAPMAAMYLVARTLPRMRPVLACAALLGCAGVAAWWWPAGGGPVSAEDAVFGVLHGATLAGGPTAVGRLVRLRGELSERIRELTASRERERRLLAETAVAEERARLAREMHDVVSHQVGLITVQAGALEVTAAEPAAREHAAVIRRLGAATLDELRIMVGVLRRGAGPAAAGADGGGERGEDGGGDRTGDGGLGADHAGDGGTGAGAGGAGGRGAGARGAGPDGAGPAFPWLGGPDVGGPDVGGPGLAELPQLVAASGLPVRYAGGRPPTAAGRWPSAVERAAYRTVQEALTNVRKYAPTAPVELTVTASPDGTRLVVQVSNGPPCGSEPPDAADAAGPPAPADAVAPADTADPADAAAPPGHAGAGSTGGEGGGGGYGLLGLRERAEQLGGTFAAGPDGRGGFTVRAELPGRPPEEEAADGPEPVN